ncbi:MAG: 50S ribosomal protein L18 [Candidatus Njordarchaeia archaeon]
MAKSRRKRRRKLIKKKRFGPRYRVPYRRRREGKTDYRTRYRLVLSEKIRAVVRKSLKNVVVQFVESRMEGDITLSFTKSTELIKYGWEFNRGNTPAAYLTGFLAGCKAKKAGIEEAILDLGPQSTVKGGRLFAALRGLVDAGIDIPHNEVIFPPASRIKGEIIANWAAKLKEENEEFYNKQFSNYLKKGLNPVDMPKVFEDVLEKIANEYGVEKPSLEDEEEEEEEFE